MTNDIKEFLLACKQERIEFSKAATENAWWYALGKERVHFENVLLMYDQLIERLAAMEEYAGKGMRWVDGSIKPKELLEPYYCKVWSDQLKKEFRKTVLITLDGSWQTEFKVVAWLDESASIPEQAGGGIRDRVREVLEEKEGYWHPCSGCHETVDGQETGHNPYSDIYKCYVGSGCRECGGIGVIWDYPLDQLESSPSPSPAGTEGLVKALELIRDLDDDMENEWGEPHIIAANALNKYNK